MGLTERILIGKTLRGDGRAFETLYRQHAPRVCGLLRRLTGGNAAEADDLTQETFVSAYQSLATWRGEGAFSTWLCGIAFRTWSASRRRQMTTVPLDDDLPVAAPNTDPARLFACRETHAALERAIAALPEHYRAVYLLIRGEGMKQREVAALLEIPLGTVQSRLGTATQRLYAALNAELADDLAADSADSPVSSKGAPHHVSPKL